MNFSIDPPSGHASSYMDIKFSLDFDKADKVVIKLHNKATSEDIHILGVMSGHILNETEAVSKNTNSIEGFFNVFNRDKMNDKLADFVAVDIQCQATFYRGEAKTKQSRTVTFYNESKSLDGSVVPFDLVVENPNIDIKHNIPLKLQIVCSAEKKYELAIRSVSGEHNYQFEVVTKKGRLDLVIPSELLFFNLGIKRNPINRFGIYYVKLEGVDLSGFRNRKFIPISNTNLKFNSLSVMPEIQQRQDPVGRDLSDDFVISDRYFVHTFREFSGYGGRLSHSNRKLLNMSRFLFEAQHMNQKSSEPKKLRAAGKQDATKNVRKEMRRSSLESNYQNRFGGKDSSEKLLSTVSSSYARKYSTTKRDLAEPESRKTGRQVKVFGRPAKKSGGCGCARKKNV